MGKEAFSSGSDTGSTEIINDLKEKFTSVTEYSAKIQILTILLRSWSIRKIQKEFQIPYYMARKTKHLRNEEGIMSTPNPAETMNLAE